MNPKKSDTDNIYITETMNKVNNKGTLNTNMPHPQFASHGMFMWDQPGSYSIHQPQPVFPNMPIAPPVMQPMAPPTTMQSMAPPTTMQPMQPPQPMMPLQPMQPMVPLQPTTPLPPTYHNIMGPDDALWQWTGSVPCFPEDMIDWQPVPCDFPTSTVTQEDLQKTLNLIKKAISEEQKDKMFYEVLMKNAPLNEDKKIIQEVRDNEVEHFVLLSNLYKNISGQTPSNIEQGKFKKPSCYCEGLKLAIIGEQSSVVEYRKILFSLVNRKQINTVVEIITDELRHAALFNYLYSKNRCTK